MSYENNGANQNGSNPYNYIGSEAHMRSLQDEMHRNQNAAIQQANQSYVNGRNAGWDAAVDKGNAIIALRNAEIIRLREDNRLQAERIAHLEAQYKDVYSDAENTIAKWEAHAIQQKAKLQESAEQLDAANNEIANLKGLLCSLTEVK